MENAESRPAHRRNLDDRHIELVTDRLRLRLPVADDTTVAAQLVGDPEVMRFLGGETVAEEHVPEVVGRWIDRWDQNGMGQFMIERRDDGTFVGRTGILVWDTRTWTHSGVRAGDENAQPELGWALVRARWGHGYATEAAWAVRDWARSERGVERLVSLIAPDNIRSQRVAEKLGAKPAETVTLFDSGPAVVWVHPQPQNQGRPPRPPRRRPRRSA